MAELLPHYGADCPAAVVAMASRPDEIVLRGTLSDIADQVKAAGVVRTAVIIVGRTLAAEQFPDSFLYSTTRDRDSCGLTVQELGGGLSAGDSALGRELAEGLVEVLVDEGGGRPSGTE
ncbi:hypothetical protein GCM10020000_11540 [Streptomyces olivoverticillatus]